MLSSEKACQLIKQKYQNVNEHRLTHIYGVAEMAEYLANIYHVDVNKAKTAAYMHDYCKYDDFKEIEKHLSNLEIIECRQYNFLYHAYGSAYYYKELFSDSFDREVFLAIHNHVFGRVGMTKLEEIICLSDYTEKNRTYPSCIKCREILLKGDFVLAMYQSMVDMIQYAINSGYEPHPVEIEVKNFYEEQLKEKK